MLMWFFGEVPVLTARSLRDEPERWSIDTAFGGKIYTIQREDGVVVWTANSSYGVNVSFQDHRWGGVTFFSAVGLSPGHWLVWQAARKWLRSAMADTLNPLTATLRAGAA